MSTFIQINKGPNSKGTQVFSSKDSAKFVQYGGGIQIIDGIEKETSNPIPSEESSKGKTQYHMTVGSGQTGFQIHNMTTTVHK